MEIQSVTVKSVKWMPAKIDEETGEIKQEAKTVLTLELLSTSPEDIKALVEYAQSGVCTWSVGLARELAGVR